MITHNTLILINCTEELQKNIKKTLTRPQTFNFEINFLDNPYLIISMCTLFFNSSLDDSTPEELITNSNDTHGKTLLQDFIYKASVFSKQFIDKKLQEIQDINNNRQKLLNTKEKLQIIIHNTDTIDIEKQINMINNHNKV